MLWFLVSVSLLAALCGAITYAAIVACAPLFTFRARWLAIPVALLASITFGSVLYRVPPAGVEPPAAARNVSCAGPFTNVHGIARGALDIVQIAGTTAPLPQNSVVDRRAALVFRGWASDADAHGPLSATCVLIDGKPATERALYGASRPDVARAFNSRGAENTGFEITIDASDIPAGPHDLVVVGVDDHGHDEPIALPRRISVR